MARHYATKLLPLSSQTTDPNCNTNPNRYSNPTLLWCGLIIETFGYV